MLVVFGSINLDLIFPLPHLPAVGETVLGRPVRMEPGGKGANQAVAAARDGMPVRMVGAVGNDVLADLALRGLRAAGADLAGVARGAAATGCASILTDPDGRNQIAVASGANLLAKAGQVGDDLLTAGCTLVLQMECDPAETEALILRARARGARIVLNLAPAAALAEPALRAADVLIVNETEAAWLGRHLATAPDAGALHGRLGCAVVRTLGADGAEYCDAAGRAHVPAMSVAVVDTTAAGDCFTGILATALDRGSTLLDAVTRATAAAALCCTRAGTQGSLPLAADTDALLASAAR